MTTTPATHFQTLRGEALRRANDEFFAYGTGPRAEHERALARQREARTIFATDGPLADLWDTFGAILNDAPSAVRT